MRTALVTGSSGLIGSELVRTLDGLGWAVHGVDNNMRQSFFGPDGDTTPNLRRLQAETKSFRHHELDVRERQAVHALVEELRPDLCVHCAAQPSHDLAARRPFEDFDVNAVGTLNLLEAFRSSCAESPFVFLSTNKVYGDVPNELELVELETRYDYADPSLRDGIDETCRIDATMHSLFGASKAAADLLVQEYGRYFGMPTVCFRGGCLTGSRHASAELHGFLAYLARCVSERRPYRIFGYKGKQVRDNIHAHDVCAAVLAFADEPRSAAVYNIGGGRATPSRSSRRSPGSRSSSVTRSWSSTSTRPAEATTSATSATSDGSRRTIRAGASPSTWMRSSTSSPGGAGRSRSRPGETDSRHRRRGLHRLTPRRAAARQRHRRDRPRQLRDRCAGERPRRRDGDGGRRGRAGARRRAVREHPLRRGASISPVRRASACRSPRPRSI